MESYYREFSSISPDIFHTQRQEETTTTTTTTMDIAVTMSMVLGTMVCGIGGLLLLQKEPNKDVQTTTTNTTTTTNSSRFLPCPKLQPSKYSYECFVLYYTPIWIGLFGMIVLFQWYESFTKWDYIIVCGGLALPLLLQPFLVPYLKTTSTTSTMNILPNSPDNDRSHYYERYCFKANVWLFVYSFIGNYWYTHYFYSVLQAKYTMPEIHRLNNVPIALIFATHFYFSTYHLFSNMILRKIVTTYEHSFQRTILYWYVIVVFSYFTAFMETLTISSYPYYTFEDRNMAYTVGSAFYGIYFLVSFPAFFTFDDDIDNDRINNDNGNVATTNSTTKTNTHTRHVVTVWDTIVSSCGYGMMILFLLDFVRLYLDIPLVVGADPS